MDMNSEEEDDDYGYMGHGEGESLDQYPVLPNIQPSLERKDKITNIKIAAPLSVLPPIATHQGLIPCPPSSSKHNKTRRRRAARKSPLQLTQEDLNPASQFGVLPEIKKDVCIPAIHRVKQQASDVSINRSNGEMNMYTVLPSIKNKRNNVKGLAIAPTQQNYESKYASLSSKEILVELEAELSQLRNGIHHCTSMDGTAVLVQSIAPSKSNSSLDSTSEEFVIDNYTASDTSGMCIESKIQRVKSRVKLISRAGSRVGGRKLKKSALNSRDFEGGKYLPAPPKVGKHSVADSKENVKLQESGYASICTKFNSGGT